MAHTRAPALAKRQNGHAKRTELTAKKAAALPEFKMRFEAMTIDHLGLRLYSTLPPVISELVSNCYDAESGLVEITLPEGPVTSSSEVVVRDYGHGMTATEVAEEYLPIGRP